MFIAYLRSNGLVLSLLLFLVTLRILTDKAGCYNVHEKKLIVCNYLYRQWLSSPCAEKVFAFIDISTNGYKKYSMN